MTFKVTENSGHVIDMWKANKIGHSGHIFLLTPCDTVLKVSLNRLKYEN